MLNRILSNFYTLKDNYLHAEGNEETVILLGIIVLTCVLYFIRDKERRNLPPGPMGLPVFGYYFFLGKKPEETINKLGKKYGNVMGLYMGSQYVVLLNDWEATKEAMSQNATLSRPEHLFQVIPHRFGVGGMNDEEWAQNRRQISRTLKGTVLQSGRLEKIVQEEATELVKRISSMSDVQEELHTLLSESFTNMGLALLLGERLPTGHPLVKTSAKTIDAILAYTPTMGIGNYSLTLSRILQFLGIEEGNDLMEKSILLDKCLSSAVEEKIQSANSESGDSFITQFYKVVKDYRKTNQNTYITEDALKGNAYVLMVGGSETTGTTILWTLIAMADHPYIQQKVHEELDAAFERDAFISWSDRFKIPYTWATVMESMRWATIEPLSGLRMTTEDIKVQGYDIPKGTFITTNIWSIHNDPRYWDNPEQFLPERFLLDDGKKVNTSPESYNPFSYGKRNCPGMLIANMQTLQFFAILMRNFKVMPKDGDKVKYDTMMGLTYQPKNFELCFMPRY